MYIDNFREKINSDLFNITGRIKNIDKDYFIVRNHQTEEFEVHHSKQIGDSFCLSIPYDRLDERTLKRVRETRIEYIDKIREEIKKNNEALEKAGDKKLKDITENVTKEVYRYASKHEDKETIDKDSNYFKGVI